MFTGSNPLLSIEGCQLTKNTPPNTLVARIFVRVEIGS